MSIKPIPGYDGYFVSASGSIWCNLGKGNRVRSRRVSPYRIHGRPGRNGYLRICARSCTTGRRHDLYIHRLVAAAFIEKREGADWINHRNCDRSDNRVENLEWCTPGENIAHSMRCRHLLRSPSTGRMVGNFDYRTMTNGKR